MQFSLRISTLLASLIILLSSQAVDSLSLSKRRPQLVTLPLSPIPQRPDDIHPQILLQMHINRSLRRLARMTGVDPPSMHSLEQRLEKRVFSVEGTDGLRKRFNRLSAPLGAREVQLEKRFNRAHRPLELEPGFSLKSEDKRSSFATESVAVANTPTTANSLGLDIEAKDVGYLATIQIGTPSQDFLLIMDSGSADFWVGGEICTSQSGGGCGNHKFLGSQTSSSFQDKGIPFEVSYGTGAVAGTIVQDNVVIASLSLANHVFGVASQETTDFSSNSVPSDGLMGLAKSSLSEQGTPTPIESLASAGLVPGAIVSYKISRLADNLNDGEITFGGLDDTKFNSSTLVTLPNVSPIGFWEVALDGASVNGVDLGLNGRTTILDTGTTLMLLPEADALAIHKNIRGAQQDTQGGFTVPCNTSTSLVLAYAGQSFTIDPRDLVFQPLSDNICVSGIASSGNNTKNDPTQWLVGDTFLKNVYLSTDVSNNTVSLAKLA